MLEFGVRKQTSDWCKGIGDCLAQSLADLTWFEHERCLICELLLSEVVGMVCKFRYLALQISVTVVGVQLRVSGFRFRFQIAEFAS